MSHSRDGASWHALLTVLLFTATSPSLAREHHSTAHGYTVALPESWIEVPSIVLDQIMESMMNEDARSKILVDAAFQPEANQEWLTYPYFMVQVIPYAQFGSSRQPPESEFDDMVRALTGSKVLEEGRKVMRDEWADLFNDATAGTPVLDRENRRIAWSISMTNPQFGDVRGKTVFHIGRESMISTLCYDLEEQAADSEQACRAYLESFRFDPAYAYDETLAERDKHLNFIGSPVFRGAMIGAFVGLAIWVKRKMLG